jgi:acyl carrier protein
MAIDAATEAAGSQALEREISELIVQALMLEDVSAADIDPEAPLFAASGQGLGLDSIDVLEIAMALNKRYGVRTKADDDRNREIFSSVRKLAAFVAEQRSSGGPS